jgi:phage baseplate assembly protein W
VDTDFTGRGWNFPVTPGPAGRLTYQGGEEKIRQSIWLILGTAPGERQMRPEFGCGIHDLVFAANTATLHSLVQQQVREALVRWEPRIDVLDVRVDAPPDQRNYLLIRVDYRIRANNALFNLVYPFFLIEGANLGGTGAA